MTIRIGIVGSDNSHAEQFAKIANGLHDAGRVAGVRCVAISAPHNTRGRTKEVAAHGGIEHVVAAPEEMVDMVDAAMVVYRHGGLHLEGAMPFIEKKIPVFIDKPLATSVRDAKKLLEAARRKKTPVASFSTLRFCDGFIEFQKEMKAIGDLKAGVFKSPGDLRSKYGGVFFYGIHAVELMHATMGYGARKVSAVARARHVLATVLFDGGRMAQLPILEGPAHTFHVTAHGTEGEVARRIDPGAAYLAGMKVFLKMVRTGKEPFTHDELLEPVKVLEAIDKSIRTKRPVTLSR